MKIADKQVRDEVKRLSSIGYEFQGQNGNGHFICVHPEFGTTTLPATPSDHRWLKNNRGEVARQMGITLAEVERRMGVEKRGAGRSRFKVRSKRKRSSVTVVPLPTPDAPKGLPTPAQRIEQIRAEIEEASVRANLAIPGSRAYAKALDEVAFLRQEYLQLESDLRAA